MDAQQLSIITLAIQSLVAAVGVVFMWGINGKFSDIKITLSNHRESLNKLFDQKQDKEDCKEYRTNCIARQRVANG